MVFDMIRLMRINELEEVLLLKENQNNEDLREMLPHLNVYVYDDNGILGYTYIVDGYIIGDLGIKTNEDEKTVSEALLSYLKPKYDELLFHVDQNNAVLKDVLIGLDFTLEEEVTDEDTGTVYDAYSYELPNPYHTN